MHRVALVLVLSCAPVACAAEAGAPAPAPPAAAPAGVTAIVPAGPLGVVLQRYEALRAKLADDNGAVADDAAALLAATAEFSAAKVPGAAQLALGARQVVDAAKPAADGKVDLKALRIAFGELSRGLVELIAADGALQAGRFLFECPMAKGYQRWVQVSPAMANPYMGKRMLECGSAVTAWKVEG